MLGYREWDWRILWTQSDVPAPAGTISVDWIPEAPSLLKRLPLTQQLRQPRDIRRNPSRLVACLGRSETQRRGSGRAVALSIESIRRPAKLSVVKVYAARLTRRKTSNRITAPMKALIIAA